MKNSNREGHEGRELALHFLISGRLQESGLSLELLGCTENKDTSYGANISLRRLHPGISVIFTSIHFLILC